MANRGVRTEGRRFTPRRPHTVQYNQQLFLSRSGENCLLAPAIAFVFESTHITLANDQLDAHFLYSIICLLQSSTCFEQRRAHHEEVNCINTASGIVPLCKVAVQYTGQEGTAVPSQPAYRTAT